MNLKQLHEKVNWGKLDDTSFKTKLIDTLILYRKQIENLNNYIEENNRQIHMLKKQHGMLLLQNRQLSKNSKRQPEQPEQPKHSKGCR